MAEFVVLLRGDGNEADRRRTLEALQRNTMDLEMCFLDPSADDSGAAVVGNVLAAARRTCVVASASESGVLTENIAWDVVQSAPAADFVLLEVGMAVGPRWHELLRDAAYTDAVHATASAVPADMLALRDGSTERWATLAGSGHGAALGEPVWGCVYVRRDAFEIALNTRWSAGDRPNAPSGSLEEFLLVPGLVHVLATAVVLSPVGTLVRRRVVPLTPAVRRALTEIEAAVDPLRVTVDMRCCAFPMSGTQVHALNLVSSLAARDDVQLGILVPKHPHDSARPYLDALPSSVTRHTPGQSMNPPPQVFHRPYQVLSENEITDVVTLGLRLVVTHQDMILDRTPAYFSSSDQWRHYSATTALTLAAADEVVFFSEHARQEAVRDGLVDQSKTSIVPPGTNHFDVSDGEGSMPSALAGRLDSEKRPFVFVIGNSYIHKNRLFALRVAEELRRVHGWNGAIVFAGGKPGDGSSAGEESAFLDVHRDLSANFVDLAPVTDGERRWLYSHAALVLFPTLYEGFGLVPFEAAAAGTPCVYSSRSSVAEYLPAEGALLELGDVAETARRIFALLESSEAGDRIVRGIRRAGSALTWAGAAESYVDVYRCSLTRPIGLSLVSGLEVIVGARSQMASDETERRVLLLFRQSAALRIVGKTAVVLGIAMRRFARRISRARTS